MLDSIEPYDIHFIQKASPTSNADAFDFSYIYKFRTERTVKYQSLKYTYGWKLLAIYLLLSSMQHVMVN